MKAFLLVASAIATFCACEQIREADAGTTHDANFLLDGHTRHDSTITADSSGPMDSRTSDADFGVPVNCGGFAVGEILTSLAVTTSNDLSLLHNIKCIEERLSVEADDVVSLTLPDLVFAGEILVVGNSALTSIEMNSLVSSTRVSIEDNSSLTDIDLPVLRAVQCTSSLGRCYYPSGFFSVTSNSVLSYFNIPQLARVSAISIRNNTQLVSFDLPNLSKTTGSNGGNGFAYFDVEGNGSLTVFGVPMLLNDCYLRVTNNTVLPNCFLVQLSNYCSVEMIGNDDPCEPTPCPSRICLQDCSQPEYYTCTVTPPDAGTNDTGLGDAAIPDSWCPDCPVMVDAEGPDA